jgi:hypothetical protein
VKSRGEFFTKLVKMNSNRVLNFASTHRACVCPLSFDLACLIFADMTVFNPTLKLILLLLCEIHRIRRFVTTSEPRSPLFPFVSSTLLIESVRIARRRNVTAGLHEGCNVLILTDDLLSFPALEQGGFRVKSDFPVLPYIVTILFYCTFQTHVDQDS